jgi:hypothetical protein
MLGDCGSFIPASRKRVDEAAENGHITAMKNYFMAPAALILLAVSLSGCVWWYPHGYDHGGYGHGGYDHGGDYGHGGGDHGGYGH